MTDPKLRFNAFNQPWEEKILGSLASTISGGGTPSKHNQEYWEGTLPWISSSDLSENDIQNINISRFITEGAVKNSATKKVTKGSVLIVSRVGVGKVAVAPHDLYTSQDFTNIIDPLCDSTFLACCLSKLMQKKLNSVQGSAIKGIPSDEIKKYSLYLPTLEEQQKIADFFMALEEKTQNTHKKLVLTLKMKRALVRNILTREIGFSSSSDWIDVTLGDVSSMIKTRKSSKFLLYVGTEDLIKDFGGLNKVKKEDVSGIYFEKDDILISNIRPYLKKLWMSDEEGIASTDVIVYRPKNIEPSLLKHILSTDSFFEHVAQGYKGSKMPRGDKSQMATFAFQIPSDEKEQKQIANFLNLIDKKITCLRDQEKALKKQKQAFMQQMFV